MNISEEAGIAQESQSQGQDGDGDGDDEDASPSTSTGAGRSSSQPSKRPKKSSPTPPTSNDVANVLSDYLANSKREQEKVTSKVTFREN